MDFSQKFRFGFGVLILSEGISGIIFFNIYGGIGFIVMGILLTILGILLLYFSVKPFQTVLPPSASPRRYILEAILFSFWGTLLLFSNNLFAYYFSGLFLSWGISAIGWNLRKKSKKIDKEFEPKLDIIEYTKNQEEEITRELKNAGIDCIGQIQMIINKIGYSDPIYSRKIIRGWPWRAKGRIVLTDKELIFLSVKKKNINFSIPISEIDAIQLFQARSGGLSYLNCEIIYGNPKISVIFMTFFVTVDIYNIKLQETLQKWYDTWH